jgi:hypothetical protein
MINSRCSECVRDAARPVELHSEIGKRGKIRGGQGERAMAKISSDRGGMGWQPGTVPLSH